MTPSNPAEANTKQPTKPEEEQQKNKEARDAKEAKLKKYMSDLDSIAVDYPDDIELKAMIVLQAWQNNGEGIEIQSFSSMNSLPRVFQGQSAASRSSLSNSLVGLQKGRIGSSIRRHVRTECSGYRSYVAHAGHTYSRLKRYLDAAWQQEASAGSIMLT